MDLIAFYSGSRRLEDIWRFSHEALEDNHDYIQWLFPLTEPSAFNPDAPVLDAATIERFRSDDGLRQNLQRSLAVMLEFYGLEIAGERIVRGASFDAQSANWLTPFNHNYLRLTRILKSLTLLGLSERAKQLFDCLEEIFVTHARTIGDRTMSFWRSAAESE